MRFSESSAIFKGKLSHNDEINNRLANAINIKDGAEKILRVSSSTTQRLDIYKTLLVANARIFNFMRVIQQEKVSMAKSNVLIVNETKSNVPTAKLCIQKIKLPLVWTMDALNNRRDQVPSNYNPGSLITQDESILQLKNYNHGKSFFCLLQIDDEIRETKIISDVYPGSVDLEFDDVIIFDNVKPDFTLVIEIFMNDPHLNRTRSLNIRTTTSSLRRTLMTNSFLLNTFERPLVKQLTGDDYDPMAGRFKPIFIPNPMHKSYYQDIVQHHVEKQSLHLITTPASKVSSCFKLLGRVLIRKEQLNSRKISLHMIDTGARLDYAHWPSKNEIIQSVTNSNSSGNIDHLAINNNENNSSVGISEMGKPLFGVLSTKVFAQVTPREEFIKSGYLTINVIRINKLVNTPKDYFVVIDNCQLLAFQCDENFASYPSSRPKAMCLDRYPDLKIHIDKETEIFLRCVKSRPHHKLIAPSVRNHVKYLDDGHHDVVDNKASDKSNGRDDSPTSDSGIFSASSPSDHPCIDVIASIITPDDKVYPTLIRDENGNNNTLSMLRIEIANRDQMSLDEEIDILNDWINCVNQQIDEKLVWSNDDVYNEDITMPLATSLTRNGSVRSSNYHIDY